MPRRDTAEPLGRVWRVIVLAFAACLGVVAVWLVVFGDSQKELQAGVLLGLWAGLLAAFLVRAPRRPSGRVDGVADGDPGYERDGEREVSGELDRTAEIQVAELRAAEQSLESQQVELRKFGELQLAREAAARREADLKLELSLRREIEHVMSEQMGALRGEVAALRAELVDKLGGELRLERIETTRLIGSDIEALHNEIRRLSSARDSLLGSVDAASARAERRDVADAEIVDADVIEHFPVVEQAVVEQTAEPEPEPEPERAPTDPPRTEPKPPPAAHEPAAHELADSPSWLLPVPKPDDETWSHDVAPPLYRTSEQVAAFTSSFDPFAGLPRLSPLPADVELIDDDVEVGDPVDERSRDAATWSPRQSDEPAGPDGIDKPDEGPWSRRARQLADERGSGRRRAAADTRLDPRSYQGRRRAAHLADDTGHPRHGE